MGKSSPNYSDIGIFSDKKETARYWDDIEAIIAEAIQKVADKSSMSINNCQSRTTPPSSRPTRRSPLTVHSQTTPRPSLMTNTSTQTENTLNRCGTGVSTHP